MHVALPPRLRAALYLVTAVLGLGLSATQAAFWALGTTPVWLSVAWAVYGVLGPAFGVTAASNVVVKHEGTEVSPWQG